MINLIECVIVANYLTTIHISFYTFAHLKCRGSKNLVITCRGTGMKFYKV